MKRIKFTDSIWRGVKCKSCIVVGPITMHYSLICLDFTHDRLFSVHLLLFDNVSETDLFAIFEKPETLGNLILFKCRL